jgi:hypothetical protein
MLASDLDNPEFAGAKNPNSMLHVEFYDFEAIDTWASNKTGIKTLKPSCPFIRISTPGNTLNILERPADHRDARRFPQQWLHFQMRTGKIANAENVPGWQIDEWDELTEDQVRNLKHLRFYTVEQIAGANDAQIQGIGMGGEGLRVRARRALSERNNAFVSNEVKARDEKIEELSKQNADLNEKLNMILERMSAEYSPDAVTDEEPKRRGRKPKTAEVQAHE